ncbi:MAG: hypothetical protein RLO09_03025 [Cyclobacteriaceae bacterium]
MTKRTNKIITMEFMGHGKITIPKGTTVTNMTAIGIDENYNFINDLSWIEPHANGVKNYSLIHDATYYGIRVNSEDVETA